MRLPLNVFLGSLPQWLPTFSGSRPLVVHLLSFGPMFHVDYKRATSTQFLLEFQKFVWFVNRV